MEILMAFFFWRSKGELPSYYNHFYSPKSFRACKRPALRQTPSSSQTSDVQQQLHKSASLQCLTVSLFSSYSLKAVVSITAWPEGKKVSRSRQYDGSNETSLHQKGKPRHWRWEQMVKNGSTCLSGVCRCSRYSCLGEQRYSLWYIKQPIWFLFERKCTCFSLPICKTGRVYSFFSL